MKNDGYGSSNEKFLEVVELKSSVIRKCVGDIKQVGVCSVEIRFRNVSSVGNEANRKMLK